MNNNQIIDSPVTEWIKSNNGWNTPYRSPTNIACFVDKYKILDSLNSFVTECIQSNNRNVTCFTDWVAKSYTIEKYEYGGVIKQDFSIDSIYNESSLLMFDAAINIRTLDGTIPKTIECSIGNSEFINIETPIILPLNYFFIKPTKNYIFYGLFLNNDIRYFFWEIFNQYTYESIKKTQKA